jgi:hypothetical protein
MAKYGPTDSVNYRPGFIYSFIFDGTIFDELWASHLLGRHLPLESLHQPCFVLVIFKIGSPELFAQGWLQTTDLPDLCLLSARIIGVSTGAWPGLKKKFFFGGAEG